MRFMVFSEKLVDGVIAIDAQHAQLIDIINHLYAISLRRKPIDELDEIFENVTEYMREHFAYEEQLMDETGYPKADEHRRHHDAAKKQIATYRTSVNSDNKTIVAAELLHFLKERLIQHMLTEDKNACAHLNAHGIK